MIGEITVTTRVFDTEKFAFSTVFAMIVEDVAGHLASRLWISVLPIQLGEVGLEATHLVHHHNAAAVLAS